MRDKRLQTGMSVMLNGDYDMDLFGFQALLERLAQSNMSVMMHRALDMILQVIRSPRGSGKRELEKYLMTKDSKKSKKSKKNALCTV